MSAIHLHAAHIAAIVGTMYSKNPGSYSRFGGSAVGCAALLAEANDQSYCARYKDAEPDPVLVTNAMIDKFYCQPLSTVEVLMAIKSYEYQSCEHDGWQGSEAQLCMSWMKDAAIRALPGYDEANTWNITELPQHNRVSLMSLVGRSGKKQAG